MFGEASGYLLLLLGLTLLIIDCVGEGGLGAGTALGDTCILGEGAERGVWLSSSRGVCGPSRGFAVTL